MADIITKDQLMQAIRDYDLYIYSFGNIASRNNMTVDQVFGLDLGLILGKNPDQILEVINKITPKMPSKKIYEMYGV